MNELLPVPFRNTTLQLIDHGGQPYVAMRPIVDGMGLAWQVQHRKLMADKGRWGVTIMVTPSTGGPQESTCIPLRKIFGWLMNISPNKVKPELRETIIAYQNECDEVLWHYWTEQSGAARAKLEASIARRAFEQAERGYFRKYPIREEIRKLALLGSPTWRICAVVARSGADAVFAVARRKGATETLVKGVSNAFSKGITPQGIGAVESLMTVISERDVADALPELFNHGDVK